MKSTGIIQTVDGEGKILIPKIISKTYGLSKSDSVEVTSKGEAIVMKKILSGCVFCGYEEDLKEFKGKSICSTCQKNIMGWT